MVPSSMGMVHGVHRHSSHGRPSSPLCLVFVVAHPCLHNGLLVSTPPCNYPHHRPTGRGDYLLRSRGKTETSFSCFVVVRDDCRGIPRTTGQLASVTRPRFYIANDGTFWKGGQGQDISDINVSFLPAVDELASIHPFCGDESLVELLVTERMMKFNNSKRGTTTWIMNNILHNTLDITMLLTKVKNAELGSSNAAMSIRSEKTPTFPYILVQKRKKEIWTMKLSIF